MTQVKVVCTTNGPTVTMEVDISGLVIDGQNIEVSAEADQVLFADGNVVILNEELVAQSATTADVTVNALHVITSDGEDSVAGSASTRVSCQGEATPAPPCDDFVTGGGWITGTPSGGIAHFGLAGGLKDGVFLGYLDYTDHDSGTHVKATTVTGYEVDADDADCRIIYFDVTINGAAGTARVVVCDKDELGRNDRVQIQLSNGYSAGGDLGGSVLGGGNFRLHRCDGL